METFDKLKEDFQKYLNGSKPSESLKQFMIYFKENHSIILNRSKILNFNIDDWNYLENEFLSWIEMILNYNYSNFNNK